MPTICSICNTCHNFRDGKGTGKCEGCKHPQAKHKCFRFSSLWTEPKCQGLITAFYNRYRGLGKMQIADDTYVRRYALQHDMFGRILQVQAARSVLNWVVAKALREAGNFPLQSLAQGVIKLAMAPVSDQLDASPALAEIAYPLLQVHDELVYECREDVADDLIEMNKYYMENAVELLVPVKASGGKADSWGNLPK
jgi:DNA polymerase-1